MKQGRWRSIGYWLGFLLLLTGAGFLLFSRLGDFVICECDEARHGANAYEMLQSGNYVVSTYEGEVDYFNLKPPLSFYGIMLGYRLFGFTALGLRFYSALSMFLCIAIVALWLKRRCGSIASLGSLLFFIGCFAIYGRHFARFGDADALMTLFYTVGILCMLDSRRKIRYLYGTALCFGLAFMAKSWHAALLPVTCLIYLCVTRDIRRLRLRHYAGLIAFGLAPVLPWAIARYHRDGFAFISQMLSRDVVDRASTVIENHSGNWSYYLTCLLNMPAVVTVCLLGLAAWILNRLDGRKFQFSASGWGVALWILVPLVLYSLCASKLEWYIYICLPGFAVMAGLCLQALLTGRKGWSRWAAAACALTGCILLSVWAVGNWDFIQNHLVDDDAYQRLIAGYFDRDANSGDHIYIEYEQSDADRTWIQDDYLTALYAGDLVCLPGGADAFEADEEHAYLICHKTGMNWDLLEEYPVVAEDHPLLLLENLN